MDILLIDNNDSFTFNIVEMLRQISKSRFPGDKININIRPVESFQLEDADGADKIILSPGPGLPEDYPVLFQMLDRYAHSKSILGVCMGHQVICQYFGAELFNLKDVVHGQPRQITITSEKTLLFDKITTMKVGLYHSWAVKADIPQGLRVIAKSEEGLVMAVQHQHYDIHAVQFHPESYITQNGSVIFENFLMA